MTRVRSFSYGGGQQSTAALVLAAERKIDYPLFIFANVGPDAEHPATLDYIETVARPYAERMGIELVEVRKARRGGEPDDLYAWIMRGVRTIPFPVRMQNGAPGRRSCTSEFKIRVIDKELRRRGATIENQATVGLGISVDEIQRVRTAEDPRQPTILRDYPLIDLGMRREDCQRVIRAAGLPLPGKSSCWFCPFHDMDAWRRLRREQPELFERACAMEAAINERRAGIGRDNVWFTRFGRPLAEVVADQLVLDIDEGDGCESGYCLT